MAEFVFRNCSSYLGRWIFAIGIIGAGIGGAALAITRSSAAAIALLPFAALALHGWYHTVIVRIDDSRLEVRHGWVRLLVPAASIRSVSFHPMAPPLDVRFPLLLGTGAARSATGEYIWGFDLEAGLKISRLDGVDLIIYCSQAPELMGALQGLLQPERRFDRSE